MLIILSFFIAHWFGSLFFQHRYASHRVFTTNKFWERVIYLLACLFEGSSFLPPALTRSCKRWFEIDPVYTVMKVMHWLRIIKLRKAY